MKRIVCLVSALIFVLSMVMSVNAEELQKTTTSFEGKTAAEIHELTIEVLKNSMMYENVRMHCMLAGGDLGTLPHEIGAILSARSSSYGIHVATRYAYGNNYREIQTRFEMGDNINATTGSAIYFMNYLEGHGINIDSGIYCDSSGDFYVFNYGGIIDLEDGDNWDDTILPNVSPGDILYVNSKIASSQMITTVKKNGVLIGTQVNNLTKNVSTPRFKVAREFNIASVNPISNTNNYFNWSNAQSSLVTTGNTLRQMNSSNSWLRGPYYDIPEELNDWHIGYGRQSYSSSGYIYDNVWCRCNFR